MSTKKKTTNKPVAAKAVAPAKAEPAAVVKETPTPAAPEKKAKAVVYKATQRFRDTDDDRVYEVGDVYEGKRAEYFAGTDNRCRRSFLKKA